MRRKSTPALKLALVGAALSITAEDRSTVCARSAEWPLDNVVAEQLQIDVQTRRQATNRSEDARGLTVEPEITTLRSRRIRKMGSRTVSLAMDRSRLERRDSWIGSSSKPFGVSND